MARATTKAVARRANLAEDTVREHFTREEELFLAVPRDRLPGLVDTPRLVFECYREELPMIGAGRPNWPRRSSRRVEARLKVGGAASGSWLPAVRCRPLVGGHFYTPYRNPGISTQRLTRNPGGSVAPDTRQGLGDQLVGQVLDQRYRVESCLARGGMATVYRALDSRLDRVVALKVMHAELARHDEFVTRFIREAKSAAKLSHPNVVAVYDQGQSGGHVYLAMEYVSGPTLREALAERGRFTPRQTLEILQPLLSALAAAHRIGMVHRDVKPENVLIATVGPIQSAIKVADFGLARTAEAEASVSLGGMLVGTASYLAPEQVSRGVADMRSDVYSTGIVAYELLTGKKPFTGGNPLEIAYQHVHNDVPPPSALVPGLDPALDALVAHATNRDPRQRPADADALLTEVQRTYSSLPDAALDLGRHPATHPDETTTEPLLPGGRGTEHAPGRPEGTLASPEPMPTLPPLKLKERTDPREPRRLVPDVRRRRLRPKRGLVVFLAVVLLAMSAGTAAWWFGTGRFTNTPNVVSLDQASATTVLRKHGLHVKIGHGQYSNTAQQGTVVQTSPGPHSKVLNGSTVTLELSLGPAPQPVPPLAGLTQQQADSALTAARMTAGAISQQYSDTVQSGEVISSDPAVGVTEAQGTAVNLTISEGPAPLPSVVGMSASDAQAKLQSEGYTNVQVVSLPLTGQTVQSEQPTAGTPTKHDARILLYAF